MKLTGTQTEIQNLLHELAEKKISHRTEPSVVTHLCDLEVRLVLAEKEIKRLAALVDLWEKERNTPFKPSLQQGYEAYLEWVRKHESNL